MARKPYTEDQSIHSMSTRQLRQYIADQADEAQSRIDSAPKTVSRAFIDLKDDITFRGSDRVKRSTSNMSKAEMREYAYTLRSFNRFDTESRVAARTDWEKNRKRYESFIRNQVAKSGADNQYWAKYITEKGNVSKKGYQEYKDFISTLKASEEYLKSFGYRTIQQYAQNKQNDLDPGNKILNKTLSRVYAMYKGQGLTQAELIDKFKDMYDDALNKESAKRKQPGTKKSPVKASTKKPKKTKSKSNVKTKTVGKMRTSGKVRNRPTK